MYYGLKQGQITQNVDNKYVFKLIHLVAQCSKITKTMLFLLRGLHHFSAFCCFLLVMSECSKVHYVALGFIYINGSGQMTKMATLKNLHLRNRSTDFNETWYVASGTLANYSLYKS